MRPSNSFLWKLVDASPREWLLFLGTALGAAFVLWSLVRIRAWYRGGEDLSEADRTMLLQIGDLHREGDLTEEEYRSIKGRLITRLDHTSSATQTREPSAEDAPDETPAAGT